MQPFRESLKQFLSSTRKRLQRSAGGASPSLAGDPDRLHAQLLRSQVTNLQLRAQLSAVGRELAAARATIGRLQDQTTVQKSTAQARYLNREELILLPRLMNLLPQDA